MKLTVFRICFVAPFEVSLPSCGFTAFSFKNTSSKIFTVYPFWALKLRFAQAVFYEYFMETHGPKQVDAGSLTLQTKMKPKHKNEVLNGV